MNISCLKIRLKKYNSLNCISEFLCSSYLRHFCFTNYIAFLSTALNADLHFQFLLFNSNAVLVLDLSATSVRDFLIPAIQNLLKDPDALDPAHKEAIEIILKERSGGTLEAISKVVGAHLGIASSVTSFFGEGGLLGKKEISEPLPPPPELVESSSTVTLPVSPAEDTRFRRIMRGNFTDMLRSKGKTAEDK